MGILLLVGVPAMLSAQVAQAREGLPVSLQLEPQKLPFTPSEFWIADVQDERDIRSAVAWLLPAGPEPTGSATQAIDLKGGGHAAIRRFVQQSLPANKKLRPLQIRLKGCSITETPGQAGKVEGRISVSMEFDLQTEAGPVHLTSYTGGVRYSRDARHHAVVEPALRQSLSRALEYLQDWMNEQAPHNEKLARGVKIFFTDYSNPLAIDTVYYSPERPLRWDDFKAAPSRSSRFAASVFPSFAYRGSSEVVEGYIHLTLSMRVYVLMENSWVKPASRDAYGLNHEQRHFDLVKLVVERFKQQLQAQRYPVADYNGLIATQYIDFFREMNKVQEAYDGETGHGLNRAAQQRWNEKIDAELRSFGIKE
ncbi:hypothetical protein [Cesiribacter andamanensis]|uniref:hypothetical protein n=1 Tax=Cesiribacter andamanensis TaxID=649507 RepID=UPI001267CFEA|nr:hypothetical protein [Cesiribacter andamanensis]